MFKPPLPALPVLLLLTTSALAQNNGGGLPPARYDRPYQGKLTVDIYTDPFKLARECYDGAQSTPEFACAFRYKDNSCRIIMLTPALLEKYGKMYGYNLDLDLVWRHEVAHCNGWPADHPQ
jgi:hypothetical protein